MTSVSYPNVGPTYTYSFDSMSRPTGLTDQNNYAAVSSVQYAPSNQMERRRAFTMAGPISCWATRSRWAKTLNFSIRRRYVRIRSVSIFAISGRLLAS